MNNIKLPADVSEEEFFAWIEKHRGVLIGDNWKELDRLLGSSPQSISVYPGVATVVNQYCAAIRKERKDGTLS